MKHKLSQIIKRIISLCLVAALFTGNVPMGDLADGLGSLVDNLTVYAVGTGTPYTFSDIGQFKAYVNLYNANPSEHKNDIIKFTFGGDSTNQEFNCDSIGSSETNAFDGTIIIGNVQFHMTNPLFEYVTDDVNIIDTSGNTATVVFTRPRPGENAPLFAKNVVHTRTSGDPVEWKFEYTTYDSGNLKYTYDVAGFIGTLGTNAKVKISSVRFNNKGVGSDGVIKANVVANSSGDAGLICGTMAAGSQLEIDSITSTSAESADTNYSVTALSSGGNAGGLVGSMGNASKLILGNSLTCFQATEAPITSSNGYAGGIVGKCDGGVITKTTATINSSGSSFAFSLAFPETVDFAEESVEIEDGDFDVNDEFENDSRESEKELPEMSKASLYEDWSGDAVNYIVRQDITGSKGSGGVAGYYKAVTDNSGENASFSTALVDLKNGSYAVNGSGACGGVFGEVFNYGTNMTITVDGEVKPDHALSTASSYGGLIGKYYASAQTLSLTVEGTATIGPKCTGGDATNYGGVIGIVPTYDVTSGGTTTKNSAYVKINGITVNSQNAAVGGMFGGVIARADEAFIELAVPSGVNDNKNKISYSGISADKHFAGVVGSLETGVLYLRNGTDLTGAETIAAATTKSGQIVGYRNCGFVFAESGWKLYRSTVGQKVDDIGSWGEVIRFNDLTFRMDKVITLNTSNHYVTINRRKNADGTEDLNNLQNIRDLEDFAIVALNAQHNSGIDGNVLKFAEKTDYFLSSKILTALEMSIDANATIDLRGTGITGLTRDNSYNGTDVTTYLEYKKPAYGNNSTLTLAIGELYGESRSSLYGNGTIYRHLYNGLFARMNGATFNNNSTSNFTISSDSIINVEACEKNMNVGTLCSYTAGNLTIYDVKSDAIINHAGSSDGFCVGGIIGKVAGSNKTITLNRKSGKLCCQFTGTITDNGNTSSAIVGGLIGYIGADRFKIQIYNAIVSGMIQSTASTANQKVGGLIGVIGDNGSSSSRTLLLQNVSINGATVEGTATNSSGGLLGYNWFKTDVTFGNGSNTKGIEITNSTMKTNAPNTAGLVYEASGYWKVQNNGTNKEGIRITSATIHAANATSFGCIINKGAYSSSAIYLELAKSSYKIGTLTTTNLNAHVGVFDELVAFSKFDGTDICDNGQGIVSINTYSGNDLSKKLKMGSDDTNTGVTYQQQSTFNPDSKFNPNTRYYYNLNDYRLNTGNSAAEQFLMWSVWQYAHSSIQEYFPEKNSSNLSVRYASGAIGASGADLDMRGYSYYPVDVSGTVNISGDVKLYNSEFDETEGATTCKRKSLGTTPVSQHYTMHNSLFRNITGSLTVNSLSLDGNVSKDIGTGSTDSPAYCGALIMGIVQSSDPSKPATVTINSISLDGIKIHDYSGTAYAPLLINKSGSNATFIVKNVSAGTKTVNEVTQPAYSTDEIIASSLIGNLGSSDASSVKITFEDIKLDGRNETGKGSDSSTLNSIYNTNRSLFSRATLLNSLAFGDSSSYGTYNYEIEKDWNGATKVGNVTYGAEIVATVENRKEVTPATDPPTYESKQNKYNGSNYYTHPTSNNAGSQYDAFATNYQNYVYTGYNTTNKTHELRVNITAPSFGGCGTYNDPYVIVSADNLKTIADIINGSWDGAFTISVPTTVTNDSQSTNWCTGSSNHTTFTSYTKVQGNRDTSLWSTGGTDPVTIKDSSLAKYLAGAYYQISDEVTSDLVLTDAFAGLSNDVASDYVFHGVIDGNGKTIVNESTNPLIVSSNGSVVRELTITVKPKLKKTLSTSSYTTEIFRSSSGGCEFYGAVMGQILGGDNIIEQVSVGFTENTSVSPSNSIVVDATGAVKAQIVPIGGYVGVVVEGGLIFKNMGGSTVSRTGITDAQLTGFGNTPLTSETYLYINPIIGRVINGYAVNENTSYHWSETAGARTDTNGVTMNNGTKNYSIADVKNNYADAEKLTITTVSGRNTVKFPNAQSMFILSLLTQSSTTANAYGGHKHNADYDEIGTSALNTGDYAKVSATYPYLVKYYVNTGSQSSISTLTSANTAYDFSLGGTDATWYLPDGFRGIGCIGFNMGSDSDMNNRTFSLHRFIGKSNYGSGSAVTINMNTSVKHYEDGFDNYLPINTSHGGLGLFNKFRHNNLDTENVTTNDKISDLNLAGSVNYDVVSSTGSMTYTSTNVAKVTYLHVGGLAGCIGSGEDRDIDSIYVDDIGIDGLEVNGFESAGGFFGYMLMANSASGIVNITQIRSTSSFTVTAKRYAGGLIGYFGQGNLTISDVTITSPNVITYFIGNGDQDFENGAGGLIGFAQNENNIEQDDSVTPCKAIELSIITIGSLSSSNANRIGYYDYANDPFTDKNKDTIVAGGIIGRANTKPQDSNSIYSMKLEKCNVYNIKIYGHRIGGLIGSDTGGATTDSKRAFSKILFVGCNVKSNNGSTIYGVPKHNQHRACGGIIGGIRTAGVTVESCRVEGYTLHAFNDTAGITANTEKGELILKNVIIKDVTIQSNYSGSLVGYQNIAITGYNIFTDNIQFKLHSGTSQDSIGYMVGKNKSGLVTKIVGFSRQETTPDSGYFVPDRMTGVLSSGSTDNDNYAKKYSYGGGYVVFSDYNGTASSTGYNTAFSQHSDLTAVTNSVYAKSPYVMINPRKDISNTQFFTSDGVSSTSYGTSAAKNIITAIDAGTDAKRYQSTGIIADNYTMLKTVLPNKISSFGYEMGKAGLSYNGKDFPVLVIDDITNVDPIVKNYIRLLTNTSYDYYKGEKIQRIANTNTKIYNVDISKWVYNNGVFANSGDAALKYDTSRNEYYISTEYDNVANQFSLIDVRFYDPSNTSSIAYHLYIPVMVEKMLYYNVNLRPASGTTYNLDDYPSGQTNLVENLGNPVTMKVTYVYDQSSTDWTKSINNGENVQRNYDKSVKVKVSHGDSSTGIPNDAYLVLVDPNHDADKMYSTSFTASNTALLSETSSATGSTTYSLNFSGFSGFTVCKMNDLMKVSTDSGAATKNLVECTGNQTPTVIINDPSDANYGKRLRVKTGNETGAYAVQVTGWDNNSFIKVEEDYYLSIFTKVNTDDTTIYHYEFDADKSFNDINYPSQRMNSETSHVLVGNLFNNAITQFNDVNTNTIISTSNNYLEAEITSQVGFKGTAIDSSIVGYIQNNDNVHIYQTFLVALQKVKEQATTLGIVLTPECSFEYSVNGTPIEETEKQECKDLGAYVEFPTIHSIKDALCTAASHWDSSQNNEDDCKITITANVRMSYAKYGLDSLVEQFPESTGSDGNGTIMVGYSNISSSSETASSSTASYSTLNDTSSSRRVYYMDNIKPVSLSYLVNDNSEFLKNGKDGNVNFGQLGINAQPDANEVPTGVSSIHSLISYNASDYTLRSNAEYMKIEVELSAKDNEGKYSTTLPISTYFQSFALLDKTGTSVVTDTPVGATFAEETTTHVYSYVIPIGDVKSMGDDSYEYEVPINFEVKTGTSFENNNMVYANYRVHVTVSLLGANHAPLRGSDAKDWIIYTNARIYRDIVTDP